MKKKIKKNNLDSILHRKCCKPSELLKDLLLRTTPKPLDPSGTLKQAPAHHAMKLVHAVCFYFRLSDPHF